MTIAKEEIFGPVVIVGTFETEVEAVQIANSSEYGLFCRRVLGGLQLRHAGCAEVGRRGCSGE
jgi:hypothetical protein